MATVRAHSPGAAAQWSGPVLAGQAAPGFYESWSDGRLTRSVRSWLLEM
jgi:hypothetical protein